MNTSNFIKITVFLLLVIVLPANAVNKSTVVNNTNRYIAVVWTALGCTAYRFGHGQACAAAMLAPGRSYKHQYRWGNTNDNIHIGAYIIFEGEDEGEWLVEGSSYYGGYNLSYLVSSDIVKGKNCKLSSPDGKTVYVDTIDVGFKSNALYFECTHRIR